MTAPESADENNPTRVLLVDDHPSLREPLAFMFDREPDFKVVAHAGSLAEARKVLTGVDLAILDLDLPDGLGTDLIDDLLAANPSALPLVLTGLSEKTQLALAVEAGAAGVLKKSSSGTQDIVEASRRLCKGEILVKPQEIVDALQITSRKRRSEQHSKRKIEKLTAREKDVLRVLARGSSDKEISEELHVGVGTVRSHVESILSKLEVSSRLQAVVSALRLGIVELE